MPEAKQAPKKAQVFETARATYGAQSLLRDGGSGVVYRVSDDEGDVYALKLLRRGLSRERVKRFMNEVTFCSRQVHKNIVTVIDSGVLVESGERRPFYVMPLYPATLRDLIGKGIAPGRVLPIYDQLLSGVEAAHLQGVVHRDLKPENILCDPNSDSLVIADFGIAQFKEEELYTLVETRPHDRLANFQYAAPEQRTRGLQVGIPADIFALGLILNEMFTRVVPEGTGIRQIAEISPDHAYLDSLVEEMRRQAPEGRPQSIASVKEKLIGYGSTFVELQRFDQLKKTVVPETELDDPLVRDPIRIVSADYDKGKLIFTLSARPNPDWIRLFTTQSNFRFLVGNDPRAFQFNGNIALTHARQNEAENPMVAEFAKQYVDNANRSYKQFAEEKRRAETENRRRALKEETAEQEKRLRIRRALQL